LLRVEFVLVLVVEKEVQYALGLAEEVKVI
jgi:hypothetical protein